MKKHRMHLMELSVDRHWTLFLDRDGVINERLPGDYVKRPEEFVFLPGVPVAIARLSGIFDRIIIVTNQQGIGKGVMGSGDLEIVHDLMIDGIIKAGGRIDKIYFSPHLEEEDNPMRKPNTGMALQAQKDFPEIDFKRSVMVGDSLHDMEFGRRLGMKCIFISLEPSAGSPMIDHCFTSLKGFADALINV